MSAKWIYVLRKGSPTGELHWGYWIGQKKFDTVADAVSDATESYGKEINSGRATQSKSNLYLVVHPDTVEHIYIPGTW